MEEETPDEMEMAEKKIKKREKKEEIEESEVVLNLNNI